MVHIPWYIGLDLDPLSKNDIHVKYGGPIHHDIDILVANWGFISCDIFRCIFLYLLNSSVGRQMNFRRSFEAGGKS